MKKVYDKPMVDIYSLNNADSTNALTNTRSAAVQSTGKVGVFNSKNWTQLK